MKEIPTKKITLTGEAAEKFKIFVEKNLAQKREYGEGLQRRYEAGEFDEIFKKLGRAKEEE